MLRLSYFLNLFLGSLLIFFLLRSDPLSTSSEREFDAASAARNSNQERATASDSRRKKSLINSDRSASSKNFLVKLHPHKIISQIHWDLSGDFILPSGFDEALNLNREEVETIQKKATEWKHELDHLLVVNMTFTEDESGSYYKSKPAPRDSLEEITTKVTNDLDDLSLKQPWKKSLLHYVTNSPYFQRLKIPSEISFEIAENGVKFNAPGMSFYINKENKEAAIKHIESTYGSVFRVNEVIQNLQKK